MKKIIPLLLMLTIATSVLGNLGLPFVEASPTPAPAPPIVINEFQAKGTEWIELYNPTGSPVSLVGWEIGDGEGNETIDTDWLVSSIPAGGYVWSGQNGYNTTLGLSNSYDQIFLYNSTGQLVDEVWYGNSEGQGYARGGCPVGYLFPDEFSWSSARAPNGQDTDDDAADWTIDISATPGAANDAPAPNLGGEGVFINEFLLKNSGGSNNESVELYNPTAGTIDLQYWWLTDDSDALYNITSATSIGPGEFLMIWIDCYVSGDILSLFTDTGVRADQLALASPSTDGESWQRGPLDGQGPNNGYDQASSGDPNYLIEAVETLGSTNAPSWALSLDIQLEAKTVAASASVEWNVSVIDNYSNPTSGVTLSASYATYGTSTYTAISGSQVDHGDGNYTLTYDMSTLKGTYHFKLEGTKSSYIDGSATTTLNVIGSETMYVLWDAAHNQYYRYSDTSYIQDTWDLWRSFPDCILVVNDQPFSTSLLDPVDILIVPYIDLALTSTEISALTAFLQDGGMVWWGGYYDTRYFNKTMNNEWITNYGIEFLLNTSTPASYYIEIHDPTDNTGSSYYPVFHTFPNTHSLITDITELSVSSTTQVYVDPSSINTTILTTGDSDTYFDGDGSGTKNSGDINGTNCVPLAVYEHGSGGALIVCGGSNFLYKYDIEVGKDQFWRNMYDYRLRVRTGMDLTVAP
ncbi:MAG: lamin tail domain-containing protein, partial [Promethearchaeota archaeon]